MSAQPRIVCAACETQEVGVYELLCPGCFQLGVQLGLVNPNTEAEPTAAPEQRIQIGPTDV